MVSTGMQPPTGRCRSESVKGFAAVLPVLRRPALRQAAAARGCRTLCPTTGGTRAAITRPDSRAARAGTDPHDTPHPSESGTPATHARLATPVPMDKRRIRSASP